jgi:hypothetical protein
MKLNHQFLWAISLIKMVRIVTVIRHNSHHVFSQLLGLGYLLLIRLAFIPGGRLMAHHCTLVKD